MSSLPLFVWAIALSSICCGFAGSGWVGGVGGMREVVAKPAPTLGVGAIALSSICCGFAGAGWVGGVSGMREVVAKPAPTLGVGAIALPSVRPSMRIIRVVVLPGRVGLAGSVEWGRLWRNPPLRWAWGDRPSVVRPYHRDCGFAGAGWVGGVGGMREVVAKPARTLGYFKQRSIVAATDWDSA